MHHLLRPTLPRLLTLVAAAWIAFWACAPSAMRPPPVGLDGDPYKELGVAGGVELTPRTRDALQPDGTYGYSGGLDAAGGQVHFGGQLNGWFYLDGVANLRLPVGDGTGGAGIGLRSRFSLVDQELFFLGLDVEAGLLYAQVALPFGVLVGDRLVLWTGPGFLASYASGLTVPLGLTLRAREGWDLTLQASAVGPFGALARSDYPFPRFPVMLQSQWRF